MVANPPYGERLGETDEVRGLYAAFGRRLRERFGGWRYAVLAGDESHAAAFGIVPAPRTSSTTARSPCGSTSARFPSAVAADITGGVTAFANRLRKNRKHLGYDHILKRIGRVKGADAFQIFMNAYTMAIEPHTNYMGPRAANDFDISMRLSLVGIGAVLAELDEYTTIRELVPGGPASLSGQLKIGDRIVGVAQGASGVMTDIMGWRLDDTVALIRGAPDSVVVLDVLPADAGPDGKHKLVSLVRKTISLEEQAAKASVHSMVDGKATRRVGVISLPSFYEDFAARQRGVQDFRSATRDVARLLVDLKTKKVDSVLIDLRNNGGGSLAEAVALTGLFIDKGPVVQQRNASGEITVESDTRPGVAWDGPLGVLINRGSASASEIFAAAIQDYGRGLIIGEPSFGKGTVQSMINLDQVAKTDKPQFGELKMTVAQFFRINGGTTQLRGVKPDILFPAVTDAENFGESSYRQRTPLGADQGRELFAGGRLERSAAHSFETA